MKKRLLGMIMILIILVSALYVSVYADETEEYPIFEGTLSISDKGIELIKSVEGCINRPMSDYSQYSIGYGCSTEFAEKYGFSTTYLSEEEAHQLLLFVLDGMEEKLDSFLSKYRIKVNQYQYDALMSFTFNLGSTWMSDSTRLGEVLVNGNYTVNEFASAMGVYCHVTTRNGPEVLDLLVDRRIREIKLFLYGAYSLNDVDEKFCTLKFEAEEGERTVDIGFYQVGEPYQILFEASPDEEMDTLFIGWYDEDGNKVTADTLAEGSMTVYAGWDFDEDDTELYFEGDPYVADMSILPVERTWKADESGTSQPSESAPDVPPDPIIPDDEDSETPPEYDASLVFSDLYKDQWYYDYVNDLYYNGVINGYEDSTFRPQNTVTTGEALKMILLAAGCPEPESVESHWARGYLNFALEQGILDPGDITDLDVPITRVLMAKIAARSLSITRLYDGDPFTDTANLYAAILNDHGIVEGYEDGTFRPDRSLTRAELSAIVWRINNYNY